MNKQYKSCQSILHVFNCFLKYSIKNTYKHLNFIIKKSILKKILKKLLSIKKKITNLFLKLKSLKLIHRICFGNAFENISQKLFLKYFPNVFKNNGMF